MRSITDSVSEMIHVIDTHQLGRTGIIAATALETGDGLALFDTGPESTFTDVAEGLRSIGAATADVRHVFLSHIHFDHAGAAWRFAELGANVYVHPRGAPHLLDPARLIESATRIFGDDMERLWGRIAPVPAQRVRIVENDNVIRLGNLKVRAIATPGHATHHHVYHWNDTLFGGDVAGVQLGSGPPIPPFVPPELNVDDWLSSIDKMRALDCTHLYLPHFGRARVAVPEHLAQLEQRVRDWANWFREPSRAAAEERELVPMFAEYEHRDLLAHGATDELVQDYEAADPSYMAVTAALRYWKKKQPSLCVS